MVRGIPSAARALLAPVVVGALAAGCASAASRTSQGYVGRPGAPRVAIAGDSITELSRATIVATLRRDHRVRINAFSGRTTAEVTPAIRQEVATHPDVEVVNLGTNDMRDANPRWRTDLDRMLALLADVPCVLIFSVYDGRRVPAGANVGTQINARLAARATGTLHLVDWNGAVRRDPGLLVADGIHPSLSGQRWIATSIRDRVRADC